jgi:hypothetical protein
MSLASAEISICKDANGEYNVQKINEFPYAFIAKVNNFFKRDDVNVVEKNVETMKKMSLGENVYFDS